MQEVVGLSYEATRPSPGQEDITITGGRGREGLLPLSPKNSTGAWG